MTPKLCLEILELFALFYVSELKNIIFLAYSIARIGKMKERKERKGEDRVLTHACPFFYFESESMISHLNYWHVLLLPKICSSPNNLNCHVEICIRYCLKFFNGFLLHFE